MAIEFGICSMKQLELISPLGWDASPSQSYLRTHLKHFGGKRQCGEKFHVKGNDMTAKSCTTKTIPVH